MRFKGFLIAALLFLLPALTVAQDTFHLWPSSTSLTGPFTITTGPLTLSSGQLLLPDGTAAAPSLTFGDTTNTGIFNGSGLSPIIEFAAAGFSAGRLSTNGWFMPQSGSHVDVHATGGYFGWSASPGGTGAITIITTDGANIVAQKNANADQFNRLYGANGGYWEHGVNSELLTIAAAATTDTTGNLLPANAIIEAVVVRVTTIIPTAATFTVGDATTAARFATGVTVAADTTAVGLLHRQPDVAAAAGPVQTTAAKIRITPNGSPAAATGVVRIEVFFSRFVPPTS